MKRRDATCALLLAVAAAAAPVSSRAGEEFADVGPAWQAAWNARQADRVAALFARDAVIRLANGQVFTGGPAISRLLGTMLKARTPPIALSPSVEGEAGDAAWISGTSAATVPATRARPARNVHGRYLLLLHHDPANGWQIQQMIWSE